MWSRQARPFSLLDLRWFGVRGVKSISAGLMFSRETMCRWAKDVVFGQIFKRGDYASP